MWDLSSLTRYWTFMHWKHEVSTTGPPGKSPKDYNIYLAFYVFMQPVEAFPSYRSLYPPPSPCSCPVYHIYIHRKFTELCYNFCFQLSDIFLKTWEKDSLFYLPLFLFLHSDVLNFFKVLFSFYLKNFCSIYFRMSLLQTNSLSFIWECLYFTFILEEYFHWI